MKTIAFLLLSAASLLSVSTSAQYKDLAVYPKWFLEGIHGRPDEPEQLRVSTGPATVKTIHLSTGVKLEYVEQGNKDGIPVILLHGFPDSWRSYEQVLNYLPQSFHVFAVSLRGHGNSDHPDKGYDPKDFAADVAAFIKAFNLPPVIVSGHSMGGIVTQHFVLNYPELVRGFVLEATFVSFADKKDIADYAKVVEQLQDPLDTAVAREFQQSTLAKPISEEYFNMLLNESMKVEAKVWKGVWKGLMTHNFRTAIYKIKKPALIIWGDKDVMVPREDTEYFQKALENAKLIEYKGSGHSLHWEDPKRFTDDVVKFIESIK